MPVVRSIAAGAKADDYRFASLIDGVVQSEPFHSSRKLEGVVAHGASAAATTASAALN
jgi:hypothetical protein